MSGKKKAVRSTPSKASEVFTEDERAAMKDLVAERRRARSGSADGESDVLAKIAEMPKADRVMAEGLHAIVKATAPALTAKTWYGMPAYAKDGQIICFFQSAHKFKARYATIGFAPPANLDEGDIWPTYFALKRWAPEVEKKISALVKRAVR